MDTVVDIMSWFCAHHPVFTELHNIMLEHDCMLKPMHTTGLFINEGKYDYFS